MDFLLTGCLSWVSHPPSQVPSLPICESAWVWTEHIMMLCPERLLWEIYMRHAWNISTQYMCAIISGRKMCGDTCIHCVCILILKMVCSKMCQLLMIWDKMTEYGKSKLTPKDLGPKSSIAIMPAACLQRLFLKLGSPQLDRSEDTNVPCLLFNCDKSRSWWAAGCGAVTSKRVTADTKSDFSINAGSRQHWWVNKYWLGVACVHRHLPKLSFSWRSRRLLHTATNAGVELGSV